MAKKIKLSLLADKVSSCIKCPSLVAGRLKTVFGEGNPDAELMIIGEAPGKTESETGIPFCGAAGTLLNNMLKAAN
jgi:uracil-DNA glycosylase family 4